MLNKGKTVKITSAAYTTKGLVKKVNQDCILLKTFSGKNAEICFAAVCDGVCGLDCGEVASSFAVETLSRWFDAQERFFIMDFERDYYNQLYKLAIDVNDRIYEVGKKESKLLGTTLTALLIINDCYYVLHVGDTRIYKIAPGFILQLTKDHTQYERYLDNGEYSAAEKNRNVLWQCVGGNKTIEPQILKGRLNSGTFLICSDGFRDEVSENEFQSIIGAERTRSDQKLKTLLLKLVELNLARNEKDNISAILIDVEVN